MNDGLIIEVENLTKRYAGHTAVSDISFSVARGEIVGYFDESFVLLLFFRKFRRLD